MRIPLDIFLSHSSEDKVVAREIADKMEENKGINVFVAHKDLEPGVIWKKELSDRIFRCDVFMALLTKNFHLAEWTEQEVGIAHAFRKYIIPIRFDNTLPMGFIVDHQARKISLPLEDSDIKELMDMIVVFSKEEQKRIDGLIQQLSGALHYHEANKFAIELFEDNNKFTDEHINNIANVFLNNTEVREAWTSNPRCLNLFHLHWSKIKSELKEKLKPHIENHKQN